MSHFCRRLSKPLLQHSNFESEQNPNPCFHPFEQMLANPPHGVPNPCKASPFLLDSARSSSSEGHPSHASCNAPQRCGPEPLHVRKEGLCVQPGRARL